MKVSIDMDITDCRDCVFREHHYGHGECWEYCSHPNHEQGAYGNILWGCQGEFKEVPKWCPLGIDGD